MPAELFVARRYIAGLVGGLKSQVSGSCASVSGPPLPSPCTPKADFLEGELHVQHAMGIGSDPCTSRGATGFTELPQLALEDGPAANDIATSPHFSRLVPANLTASSPAASPVAANPSSGTHVAGLEHESQRSRSFLGARGIGGGGAQAQGPGQTHSLPKLFQSLGSTPQPSRRRNQDPLTTPKKRRVSATVASLGALASTDTSGVAKLPIAKAIEAAQVTASVHAPSKRSQIQRKCCADKTTSSASPQPSAASSYKQGPPELGGNIMGTQESTICKGASMGPSSASPSSEHLLKRRRRHV